MIKDDISSGTTPKTLWTETVLELLYQALKYNKSDNNVKKILREALLKGCKPSYLITRVTKHVNEEAASRIKKMMQK